ncbi:MAG: AMP-binding protein [Burkholderiales bacterium]|nr:AMP-binding protein [Burkholderiales bacterium]
METSTRSHATDACQENRLNRIALGDTLHRAARKYGERSVAIEGGQRTSYAELDAASNQFAHYLLDSGLPGGARVAMLCNNSTQFLIAAYGILKAGLVWVPLNTQLAPGDVRYIVEHAQASLVVVDDQLLAQPGLRYLFNDLKLPLCVCETGGAADHGLPVLRQRLQGRATGLPSVTIQERDLALIMYTSGTTGRQKGAMHSHLSVYAALISNIAQMGISHTDVLSCILPLFHCAQFSVAASCIVAGASMLIKKGFDAGAVLDGIAKERVTVLFGLPMMYAALLQHPARKQRDLGCLRLCMYAMAPMAKPLLLKLIEEVCPNFALGSGQTEIFPMTMYFSPDQQLQRFGNYWGLPTPVNEVAIMDEAGKLLERGQVGEIVHRGPNVMLAYYKDPDATAQVRRYGWHHTGDLGKIDQDGQLLFMDRMKDMIKTGGENVASVKVEEVLLRHPAVANAAVVGVPHPHWVEGIAAFVMRKPGVDIDADGLLAHCREHLAGFEVPKHIGLLDKLPMTSSGKIQKHVLRATHRALFELPE